MACCAHCRAAEAHFSAEIAERDLERYRKQGPDPTTRALLEGVRALTLQDAHLLDVGAGVGVLYRELLNGSVTRATCVEAAPAYTEAARREDAGRGFQDRVRYLAGDAVELADDLPAADVVTLDRVICCYPEWEPLVRATAARAERYYGFSVPRDRWPVRAVMALENLVRRIKGNAFRTFVHPVAAMDKRLRIMGFRRRFVRRTFVWHVALYEVV